MMIDLFQDTLAVDKLESFRKTKKIGWMDTADLRVVNSESELVAIVAQLVEDTKDGSPIAVDTETTGLRVLDDKIVGLSIAWRKKSDGQICAFYVPILSEVDDVKIPFARTRTILQPILEQKCVYYHFKFDYKVFRAIGIEADLLADVQMMQLCINGGLDEAEFHRVRRQSLKERFFEIFGNEMITLEEVLGKGNYNFKYAPLSMARMYASTDAYATLMLYENYLPKIDTGFVYTTETKLLKIVAEMEFRGIGLDRNMLMLARDTVKKECDAQLAKIKELAGDDRFDVDSPKQLSKILFEKLGLKVYEYTAKTNQPKTDAKTLEKLKGAHPIIDTLLVYKENSKLLNTFLDKLPSEICMDGHVHTSYSTWGAISGRFTSSDPNLQQIPKGKKKGSNKGIIRKAFKADEGYYLLDVDYSQIEYRIFASMCGDKNLVDAFYSGVDFHQMTAATMFNKKPEDVTDELRHKGKTINFGLLFGMSPQGLSRQLKCSVNEAEDLFEKYFVAMPDVQPWVQERRKEAENTGFTLSYFGRKRLLPILGKREPMGGSEAELKAFKRDRSEALRASVNHRVQGTAADILKVAMIRVWQKIRERNDIQMLMQVHDELVFQVKISTPVEEAVALVKEAMELVIPNFVPIKADFAIGYNWGTMVDYEPGMSLDNNVPLKEKLTIVADDPEKLLVVGSALKELFEKFKGDTPAFIELDNKILETENKIVSSKNLIDGIVNLGLVVA